MNRVFLILATMAISAAASAQTQSLGSTMDVFIFPSEGQDSGQQSKDEAACYEWADGNTGTDPFELAKQEQADEQQAQTDQQAAQQAGTGSGARGALRGATEQQLANFKKAFSVCLEAKEYMVKY